MLSNLEQTQARAWLIIRELAAGKDEFESPRGGLVDYLVEALRGLGVTVPEARSIVNSFRDKGALTWEMQPGHRFRYNIPIDADTKLRTATERSP